MVFSHVGGTERVVFGDIKVLKYCVVVVRFEEGTEHIHVECFAETTGTGEEVYG